MTKSTSRTRESANNPLDQKSILNVNERILKECHDLYADSKFGLVKIAGDLGLKILAPRKKINIMLIGNHSAGKSSFINWYIEEHIQKTGVAIETQGFSFVTSGKKRESLLGKATLHLYPHFKPLAEFPGVLDYLSTEISTSKHKKFNLITFVDTPGLVDGDMNYPFDVNETILWLGDLVDLVFVFFDPIGQALCKRTLNIVEELSNRHPERVRFYLSKADEAGYESDRQRVMMQIVQELCKRPGLNKTGFDMPTIFIPNPNKEINCVNQINDVCRDIEKTISHTIQNTLNYVERDCDKIKSLIDEQIEEDNKKKSQNMSLNFKIMGMTLIVAFLMIPLVVSFFRNNFIPSSPTFSLFKSKIEDVKKTDVGSIIIAILGVYVIMIWRWNEKKVSSIPRKRKNELLQQQKHVDQTVKEKRTTLYLDYLDQMLSSNDI
ncbi:sarcalumenin [Lepeophtheirus salmonis]|uniref:sarcalumenin n=1 Tax=Lepeophtheirus salmonis TaxID=72036 RepID=UPI001AE29AEB|nr:sarcalumenin-like [Lepeophtheirus salmonis]